MRLLMAIALLLLAFPVVASAQIYRTYDRDYGYDRNDRRELRQALNRLDNSSARLESDLNYGRSRRVFGFLSVTTVDSTAIAEVRDFRRAVRQLRQASDNGRDLRNSYDEARSVINRGIQLDRYLRLRTGRGDVDSELSDIRSNLHVIAEVYNMNLSY
jgi:hypothetical protein